MSIDVSTPCNIILRMLLQERPERNKALLAALSSHERTLDASSPERKKIYTAVNYLQKLMAAERPAPQEFMMAAIPTELPDVEYVDFGRAVAFKPYSMVELLPKEPQDSWDTGEVMVSKKSNLDSYIPEEARTDLFQFSNWMRSTYPNFQKSPKSPLVIDGFTVAFIGGTVCPPPKAGKNVGCYSIGCAVNDKAVTKANNNAKEWSFRRLSTPEGNFDIDPDRYWARIFLINLHFDDVVKTWVHNVDLGSDLKDKTKYFLATSMGLQEIVSEEYYRRLHAIKNPQPKNYPKNVDSLKPTL